jgi:hypothetical protein
LTPCGACWLCARGVRGAGLSACVRVAMLRAGRCWLRSRWGRITCKPTCLVLLARRSWTTTRRARRRRRSLWTTTRPGTPRDRTTSASRSERLPCRCAGSSILCLGAPARCMPICLAARLACIVAAALSGCFAEH